MALPDLQQIHFVIVEVFASITILVAAAGNLAAALAKTFKQLKRLKEASH